MVKTEELARIAWERDNLQLRSLIQDFLLQLPHIQQWPPPATDDPRLLAVAASLVELLAQRSGQAPPSWTAAVGPLSEPFFLVKSADHLKHLRSLCEIQAPDALKKRRIFAPPNFLTSA